MKDGDKVHVWITKYALTGGVVEGDAVLCSEINENMIEVKSASGMPCHYHKNEWFLTEKEAAARVVEMADAKIKSLEKQLAKVKFVRKCHSA